MGTEVADHRSIYHHIMGLVCIIYIITTNIYDHPPLDKLFFMRKNEFYSLFFRVIGTPSLKQFLKITDCFFLPLKF